MTSGAVGAGVPCPACDGKGWHQGDNGQREKCGRCNGFAAVPAAEEEVPPVQGAIDDFLDHLCVVLRLPGGTSLDEIARMIDIIAIPSPPAKTPESEIVAWTRVPADGVALTTPTRSIADLWREGGASVDALVPEHLLAQARTTIARITSERNEARSALGYAQEERAEALRHLGEARAYADALHASLDGAIRERNDARKAFGDLALREADRTNEAVTREREACARECDKEVRLATERGDAPQAKAAGWCAKHIRERAATPAVPDKAVPRADTDPIRLAVETALAAIAAYDRVLDDGLAAAVMHPSLTQPHADRLQVASQRVRDAIETVSEIVRQDRAELAVWRSTSARTDGAIVAKFAEHGLSAPMWSADITIGERMVPTQVLDDLRAKHAAERSEWCREVTAARQEAESAFARQKGRFDALVSAFLHRDHKDGAR